MIDSETMPPKAHRLPRMRVVAAAAGATLAASVAILAAGSASAFASPAFNGPHAGTVYTETNQVAGNAVNVYRTGPDGSLTLIDSVPTGGTGTGEGTGSQGGVTLGDNGSLLAVVNAGSNNVSVFGVAPSGQLRLIETTSSGGVDPISVTINGVWVYALNDGSATTAPNIGGFNFFARHSVGVEPLNAAASSPEQISFTPNGRRPARDRKGEQHHRRLQGGLLGTGHTGCDHHVGGRHRSLRFRLHVEW